LLIWYFESAVRRQEQEFGRLSAVVERMEAGQQKIAEQVVPNFRQVSLSKAFQIAAGTVPRVGHLRVYAVTSQQIISFLQHSGISAERCSLLIRKPVAGLPLMNSQLEATILDWKALEAQGLIGSLEIRRYDFPPLEYEVMFDSSFLISGLYHPSTAESYGVRVRSPIVVHARSSSGAEMISEHIERFDSLFESCQLGTTGKKGASAAQQGRRRQVSTSKAASRAVGAP